MAGSSFGELFCITTFGESHGISMGVVIDGIEPGFPLDLEAVQFQMDRRKPGQSSITTERKEYDRIKVISGLFQGKTTGSPLTLVLMNEDQAPKDYDSVKDCFRPGHGDWSYHCKYGHRDYRGGGRASGRETSARVAAGAVARQLLASRGITVTAYTESIRNVRLETIDLSVIDKNPVRTADMKQAAAMEEEILRAASMGESVGGIVACRCTGVPPGLGDPVFRKLDALLAQAIVSIGAVKGIEFGSGFQAPSCFGSRNNDPMTGYGTFDSNNAGGILSGISTGQDIEFRLAVKPTPSVHTPQQTVDVSGSPRELIIEGRHDPCIVPRIIPVVESMASLVLIDCFYGQYGRHKENSCE